MNVISGGKHVAMIVKLPRIANYYRAEEPWALLHNSGHKEAARSINQQVKA